jgi:glutaconate CoA-transferase subunit A
LTTERIVSNDQIRRAPDQTKIPFFCVDAVVEVPYGAMPHECYGIYEPAMEHLDAYVAQVNGDPIEGMRQYLGTYVYGPKSWNEFLALIGMEEIVRASRKGESIFDI